MPAGSKPGEHRGGRKRGTPNKRTLIKTEQANQHFAEAKASGRRLAIDELEWLMQAFKEAVQYFKPQDLANMKPDQERQFVKYATLLRSVCMALAPYQSATFRSILLSQPVAESQRDQSAAERLIQFFDSLAEAASFEREQRRKQKVKTVPRVREWQTAASPSLV
jgi:hypothetical protein